MLRHVALALTRSCYGVVSETPWLTLRFRPSRNLSIFSENAQTSLCELVSGALGSDTPWYRPKGWLSEGC